LLHVAVSTPERLRGGLAVDLLGGVGDGGNAAFEAEMLARTPAGVRDRVAELDEKALREEATLEDLEESFRLVWPAYFASSDHAMPYRAWRFSLAAYPGLWASLNAELPALEAALGSIAIPLGVVAGGASPMPVEDAAAATAHAIPGAWLEVVDGAGHFPWFEHPGCIRAALDRLAR
jgi:pimeloyl-ACP methyl ester carboxylesterase